MFRLTLTQVISFFFIFYFYIAALLCSVWIGNELIFSALKCSEKKSRRCNNNSSKSYWRHWWWCRWMAEVSFIFLQGYFLRISKDVRTNFFSTMNAICIYGNIREKNFVPTAGKYFRADEDDDDSEKIIKLNVMSFHEYQAYMYFSSSPTQTYK